MLRQEFGKLRKASLAITCQISSVAMIVLSAASFTPRLGGMVEQSTRLAAEKKVHRYAAWLPTGSR